MTTIAWDGVTLAADCRTTESGSVYRVGTKIVRIPGGFVACCGETVKIQTFLSWARKGGRGKSPLVEGIGAVLVKHDDVYWVEEGTLIQIPRVEKIATGSGWRWARAAMDFGCNAVEAVAYASLRDCYTGGGVDFVRPFGATQVRLSPKSKRVSRS